MKRLGLLIALLGVMWFGPAATMAQDKAPEKAAVEAPAAAPAAKADDKKADDKKAEAPAAPAEAAAAAPPAPNKGDTAWMLTSTALVLLMSVPALALFYGGLVRSKNMLSVLMQVFVTF